MQMIKRVRKRPSGFAQCLFLIFSLFALSLMPTLSWAKDDYTFKGRLQVELPNHLQSNAGNSPYNLNGTLDLSGVDVRVVRAGGTKLRGKTPDAQTGPNGRFNITKSYPRDRNGFLPGGRDIRFNIDVRFRNNNLKIRKGGWGKVNWYTVARVNDSNGGTNRAGDLVFNADTARDLDTDRAVDHAQIYWIYQKALQKFEEEGVGFPNKVTATYPHKNVFQDKDTGFAMKNIFLGEDDQPSNGDEPRTMLHEIIHVWHVQKLPGNKTIKCLFDGHHNDPDNLFPSRCSGFTEGLAEAMAERLEADLFGKSDPPVRSLQDLRNYSEYSIDGIKDANRSDVGWENVFALIMTQNEWNAFPSVNASSVSCNPGDLTPYEILSAIEQEDPKPGQMTIARLTNILANRTSLSEDDAAIYQRLGDPSNDVNTIINEECGGSTSTSGSTLKPPIKDIDQTPIPPVLSGADFSGKWNTSFGTLRLYQVQNYVIGDYAGRGIILGKVKGDCVAGEFTNDSRSGVFRFKKSGDDSFKGSWAWHGDQPDGSWNGSRTSKKVQYVHNFTRDDSKEDIMDNDRDVYDGVYDSSYGNLKLFSRDMFLIGDYDDKGIIAGIWTDNGFEGVFTNEKKAGWFDWEFFSKNGTFRRGSWGWIGGGKQGNWDMTEKATQKPDLDNMVENVNCK